MNVAAPINTRVFFLIGAAALAAVAFFVLRPILLDSDDSSTPAVATVAKPVSSPATPATKPATAKPAAVKLVQGLPAPLARKLRQSKVVVVSLWASGAPIDRQSVAEAKAGAGEVKVGFVTLNVLDEKIATQLATLVGPVSAPSVLVVKRPGKVVFRTGELVDREVVAQAAQNARKGS